MEKQFIDTYFNSSAALMSTCMESDMFKNEIWNAGMQMADAINRGRKILACGNGGSMSDAMHFCAELIGRYKDTRTALPAIALSDPGALSCIGNDFGYDAVFRRMVNGLGNSGDVLLAISTSGRSMNVAMAIAAAKARGITVVALTGDRGIDTALLPEGIIGRPDYQIKVPSNETGLIQQIHIIVIHMLVEIIESKLGTR